jgi:hypothetical protein
MWGQIAAAVAPTLLGAMFGGGQQSQPDAQPNFRQFDQEPVPGDQIAGIGNPEMASALAAQASAGKSLSTIQPALIDALRRGGPGLRDPNYYGGQSGQ